MAETEWVLVPREALSKFVHQYEQEFDPEAVEEARPKWIRDALSSISGGAYQGEDAVPIADRLRYRVDNPSAWPESFDQAASDLFSEAVTALLSQASQIEALRKERDAALRANEALNSAIDRCRLDASAAETKLAEAVEQAFRDGLAYGTNVRNADPDLAWGHSRAKAFLDANGGGNVG